MHFWEKVLFCTALFFGQSCAAYAENCPVEANLGSLRSLGQQADLLEATKRVRRLEAEIAELEAKARERREVLLQRKEPDKELKKALGPQGQEKSTGIREHLPRVLAIERGMRGVYAAKLLWPDGQSLRVNPQGTYRGLKILAISRERVVVRTQSANLELDFAQ